MAEFRTSEHFKRQFPEQLADLIEPESADPSVTFPLEREVDAEGRPIEGSAFWLALRQGSRSAEGKLFLPHQRNGTLVLFEQGLPGNSASWMEQRHVPVLLREGYASIILRHLGERTDSPRAAELIASPERIARGNETGNAVIGGDQEYDLEQIAREPATALQALGSRFDRLALVGHSAGALHNAYALQHLEPELRDKVKTFISLSGFIGRTDQRTANFQDLEGYYEYCRQFIQMGDPKRNVELLHRINGAVYEHGLPEQATVVTVNSPEDEFFPLETAQSFQERLQRGVRIIDGTQFEPDFHDLKNLRPQTLLRFLKMDRPAARHTVTVTRREPKG